MPIKGLTDQVQPAFPRLGKLRKGAERSEEDKRRNKPGKDLKHFRFTSDRPEVQKAFDDAYGSAPVLVNAYLPYADVDSNFQCWKEAWVAGGLKHRCDGETMMIWLRPDGTYSREPRPCNPADKCEEVGRLIVIIPEIVQAGYVGYVTVETHGIHDLLSIQASLLAAYQARRGDLRGIPFTIRRQAEKISTPMGDGKRARREKWLIKVEPLHTWMQLQIQTARQAAMGMLEAPKQQVDEESGEIIEAEAVVMHVATVPIEEPPEPPTENYSTFERERDFPDEDDFAEDGAPEPTQAEIESPARPAGNGERAALLADIDQLRQDCKLTEAQVKTWAGKQWSREWDDLTIAHLKATRKALTEQRDGAKGAAA